MKGIKTILIMAVFGLMILGTTQVKAQCAMCSATVASNNKSGAKTTNGLNNGIMYLLAAPYLAAGIVGFVWYKRFRRKNVNLHMRPEKLNLN